MISFAVVDVETANPDLESICQIGVVCFNSDGSETRWESLVDPDDYFDPFNVHIHGIDAVDVRGSPTFDQVYDALVPLLRHHVVVSHTHFDRLALQRACARYGLPSVDCTWLDSARVARRAWPERYSRAGYSLGNIAADLGIEFRHHNALEDAWAAGKIILQAINHTGLELADWIVRAHQPILPPIAGSADDPNPEGPLYGEVVCFTGALTIPRREAASLAARAGCVIADGVTKETSLLIVGSQDVRKLAGHTISSKHRKAERLIAKGQHLRILAEHDFRSIASVPGGQEPIRV